MTIRFNPRWLLVFALVFTLQISRAQTPVVIPPVVSFDLGDTNNPDSQLWDLQGTYRLDVLVQQKNGLATPFRLSFVLLQDPTGKLSSPTNDNTEEMEITDNGLFAVLPKVTGKVTGSGGTAQVTLNISVTGSGTLSGQPVDAVKASFKVKAETDPSGNLVGISVGKFSANISGQGSISGTVPDFSTPMPNGANATWNLSLQMAGLKSIAGSAIATTPNRALGFDLSGKYNGIFNISAKGAGDVQDTSPGTGASGKIQVLNTFDSMSFNGKILGQKLLFSADTTD
jgi:hypothetical protein